MPQIRQVPGWINPLAFTEVDEPWASSVQSTPTLDTVLQFLCPANEPLDLGIILARYREISTEPVRLFLAPNEQRVLDKLVWPLRHAKASYMVGNYLATIALSGMVAEMVAILLWEMASPRINQRILAKEDERRLFGSEFEKLGQERRVSVLSAYGVITDERRQDFDIIRQVRRRYLHLWSQDHERLPKDAVQSFHSAVSLVVDAIGQNIKEGKLVLNPSFADYLERKGIYTDTPVLLDDGSAALPDEIVAEGMCQCDRDTCVGRPDKCSCVFTREHSNWVLRKQLYWRCYEEVIDCPRCAKRHKRGHVGKLGSCDAPYINQEEQID